MTTRRTLGETSSRAWAKNVKEAPNTYRSSRIVNPAQAGIQGFKKLSGCRLSPA